MDRHSGPTQPTPEMIEAKRVSMETTGKFFNAEDGLLGLTDFFRRIGLPKQPFKGVYITSLIHSVI